jgi:hypothetical protein
MRRTKTRAGRSRMVPASSSSSEDDISLGASQEEAHLHHLRRQPMLSLPVLQRQCAFAAESIYPQVRGTVEGRPFNVSLLRF